MDSPSQEALFSAMADPDFYPHPVRSVTCEETHISKVFLTGETVYKIKKAVDFGFLDFSTLAKRRHCCEQEVALNRRLTDGVYREVVAIRRTNGGFSLSGCGDIVEYAVCMRQLSDQDSLAARLQRNAVSVGQVEALAQRLIDFYRRQDPVHPELAAASWENVRSACEENFRQIRWAVGDLLDPERYNEVVSATRSFLSTHIPLFRNRIENGCIRDGHGDLRAGHIYFDRTGSFQIIDCIEFNPRLRQIDIASDLAFLAMDLDVRGARTPAMALMEVYARETRDFQAYALLPFYMGYRAMVRCKVNCIRLKELAPGLKAAVHAHDQALRYLARAHGYTQHFARPTLWVLCGLPATGKSTLARALSRVLMVKVWRSDVVRKQKPGHSSALHPESGDVIDLYSEAMHRRTYAKILDLARTTLDGGKSVILDATFSEPDDRRKAIDLAGRLACRILFVECTAPAHLVKSRLAQREGRASVSDARLHHYELLKRRYIAPDEIEPTLRYRVDTTRPVRDCIQALLSWRCAGALGRAGDIEQTAAETVSKGGPHVQNNCGGNRSYHHRGSNGGSGSPSGRREQQPACHPPCS
jgi:aminoglycoside phosphotransferase family enzyme/predicted kinase